MKLPKVRPAQDIFSDLFNHLPRPFGYTLAVCSCISAFPFRGWGSVFDLLFAYVLFFAFTPYTSRQTGR